MAEAVWKRDLECAFGRERLILSVGSLNADL